MDEKREKTESWLSKRKDGQASGLTPASAEKKRPKSDDAALGGKKDGQFGSRPVKGRHVEVMELQVMDYDASGCTKQQWSYSTSSTGCLKQRLSLPVQLG